MIQREQCCWNGQGRTTGHQKRMPVNRKHACSRLCHPSELRANSYAAGTCQMTYAAFIAIHAIAGRVRKPPTKWTVRERNNGRSAVRISQRGRPRSMGTTGEPRTSNGGAMDIRTKCCPICMKSNDSLKVSSGEATATKMEAMPHINVARRHLGNCTGRVR